MDSLNNVGDQIFRFFIFTFGGGGGFAIFFRGGAQQKEKF